ncbi:glycosyltransferase family 87 protein [Streptomyces sp. NPDC001868]|uniref:glycosyltransferase family 87 protein n=1 Tax=Streptomyces sp. NPDC001868 TaxID=3154401 RepID=UPI00331D374B
MSAVVVVWCLTRLWLVPTALGLNVFTGYGRLDPSVDKVYRGWYEVLSTGSFPAHDVTWQYPPGAALPVLAPALVPGLDYGHAFIVLSALCDLLIFVMLLWAARVAGRGLAGAWLWTVGMAALSTLPWNRFDLLVTGLAMAALVVAAGQRAWSDRAFGVLVALGSMVKVWPVLLLIGTRKGRGTRRVWVAAALTALAVTASFVFTMPNAFSFLSGQKSRGIQIESVGAMPFHLARHLGWSGTWAAKDGSHEFVGPYVEGVSLLMQALTVLAFGWLLWWRHRSDLDQAVPYALPDAALTAALLFVVTSRVISPQYMVWLIGLAAVCLLRPDTTQRPVAYLLLAACVLTTLDFPLLYRELRDDGAPLAIANLYARNLLLVAAAVLSGLRLWRATALRSVDRAFPG